MSWYRAGTITLTPGSTTVTGVGTQWVANILPAAMLLAEGAPMEVARAVSDSELLLKVPFAGVGGAGLAYAIAPTQSHVTEATRLLLQVLETFGDLRQAWLDGSLKGDPGTGLAIRGAVANVGALPANPRLGDAYLIGPDVYVWVGTEWFNAGPLQGATGLTGPANVLTIGAVTAGETGTPASATITGVSPNQVLNLVLPRGLTGTITPQLQALHDDALQARDDAQDARDVAGGHAGAAASFAGNAAGSATAAAGSATEAAGSESGAAASAAAAAGSATAAAQSVTNAAAEKTAAQQAAEASADSALVSAGHAGDAGGSAAAAAASEGAALGHAEAAADSATDAAELAAQAGISAATINLSGHLLITRADGTVYDAGYVMGPTGPVGASISIRGNVPTVGGLPASGNAENDAWLVQADGHLYVWDGAGWTDVGQFQGPPGVTDYNALTNTPTLGTAAALNVPAGGGAAAAGQVVLGNDPRLSDARNPLGHTHTASQISDSTATGRQLMTAVSGAAARTAIGAGTSSFSGAWADLTGKPAAIGAGDTPAEARAAIGAGTSSFSGSYADLSGKPTLGTAAAQDVGAFATAAQGTKADSALQADSLKTINGESIVGAGDITVSALTNVAYEDRAALRAVEGGHAMVAGLGLFVWTEGSDEPDDDESCFATATGRWLLDAVHWDVVDAWNAPQTEWELEQFGALEDAGAALVAVNALQARILTATAASVLTSVSAVSQASFTAAVPGAAVGDAVFAAPPNALGARIATFARVTAADTVTVYVNNPSAASQSLTAGSWSITVIKGA